MKKAIILPLFILGLGIFLVPTRANAGFDGSCELERDYMIGEVNGVKFDMADVYADSNISEERKKELFIIACKRYPPKCFPKQMKYHYVDAVCSNASIAAEHMYLTIPSTATLLPKRTGSVDSDYEKFRVSLPGFAAYVGRKEILDFTMNGVPASSSFKRATMGDKMPGDRDYKTTIDMTLYDVAMNGRKLDDVENPVAKPFITFIQAEKKKWDAQQNFAAKMHDDLVKAAKGGKMAIDNYTGKNLALDGKTYNEINKLLKLNRI